MTNLNEIEKDFLRQGKATLRSNIVLLGQLEAIAFVKECEKRSVNILGIDGFYIRGDSIQSSMANSIDFNSPSFEKSTNVYSASVDFISAREEGLSFEIVCEG